MIKMKDFQGFPSRSEYAEFFFDRHTYIMAGVRARVEMIDWELSQPGITEDRNNFLLEARKDSQEEMKRLSEINTRYLEMMDSPRVKLAFSYEYTNAQGQTVRIEVKPTWREKIYNNVNKILRRVLLGE